MPSSGRYFRNAPAKGGGRIPSFEAFLKMGGIAGMVRRIVCRWNHPFNANQVKVAFHRQHPDLLPGDHQIEDIIDRLVFLGKLHRGHDGNLRRAIEIKSHLPKRRRVRIKQVSLNL
jgi:hypothetical protein